MIDAEKADLHIADPTTRLAPPPGRANLWASAPFLAMAAACAVFAFVNLGLSSYWIDELFSVYVINHTGGFGEVLRRALTDTHPPAYYFLIYPWTQVFGSTSEAVTRSLSAICAVAALPVFFLALRHHFSLPARAFALALGASSMAFYDNAQTSRSYGLCLLVASGLLALTLAIHRRLARREPLPAGMTAAFWALSVFAAFTHFYLLLVAGGLHLFLLLRVRTMRDRLIIVVSGLTVVALISIYVVSLVHSTEQPFGNMWFNNTPKLLFKQTVGAIGRAYSGLIGVGLVLLALAPLRERLTVTDRVTLRPQRLDVAPLALIGIVTAMTIGTGLAISILFVPSYGQRNLLVLMPFWWMLAAWLYDRAAPDPRQLAGKVLIGLLAILIAINCLQLKGRFHPRQEEWRASAAFVDAIPACRGQPIPAVLPWIFGPSTPYFRSLAQNYFFGRYETDPQRLMVMPPVEFSPSLAAPETRALLQSRATAGCPVLAWGVHDLSKKTIGPLRRDIAATAGLPEERVVIRKFDREKIKLFGKVKRQPSAYVYMVER